MRSFSTKIIGVIGSLYEPPSERIVELAKELSKRLVRCVQSLRWEDCSDRPIRLIDES